EAGNAEHLAYLVSPESEESIAWAQYVLEETTTLNLSENKELYIAALILAERDETSILRKLLEVDKRPSTENMIDINWALKLQRIVKSKTMPVNALSKPLAIKISKISDQNISTDLINDMN